MKLPWQPIETAPKDGTEVILWCEGCKAMLKECRWDMHLKRWVEWDIGDSSYYPLASFEVPTHWIQLTPPE